MNLCRPNITGPSSYKSKINIAQLLETSRLDSLWFNEIEGTGQAPNLNFIKQLLNDISKEVGKVK